MPQVPVAHIAEHLYALHVVAVIEGILGGTLGSRLGETRPAGNSVVLFTGMEQKAPAPGASILPGLIRPAVGIPVRRFGSLLPQDTVPRWLQQLLPLLLCFLYSSGRLGITVFGVVYNIFPAKHFLKLYLANDANRLPSSLPTPIFPLPCM